MLVKRIITQCTTICSVDQITVTALDDTRLIGLAWNEVIDTTIRNCFRAASFSRMLSDQRTLKNDALSIDDDSSQDSIQQLADLLSHVRIDDNQ